MRPASRAGGEGERGPGGPAQVLGNVFWAAKDEQAPGDWEDGAALDLGRGRLAVADGASTAYRAREWATHLVERYVAAPPPADADAEQVLRWFAEAGAAWTLADSGPADLEWYHRDAARRGSFAAFVGALLTPTRAGLAWSAVAVGDCCLLQVRDDRLVTAFPLSDPASFGNAPVLVPSAADKVHRLRDRVGSAGGLARAGDVILLSSDAFAKFLLTEDRHGGTVWPALRSFVDNQQFVELIRYLRREQALEIDDVTLLRVVVTAA